MVVGTLAICALWIPEYSTMVKMTERKVSTALFINLQLTYEVCT